MKAVMLSIQPKWCELIVSGKKTVKVRKTKPKLETPFKCYIYETKAKDHYAVFHENTIGKVIGEFVCDNIWETFVVCDVHDELPSRPCEYWLEWESDIDDVPKEACLSAKEIMSYLGKQYNGFAWHISDLVIYDEPKELSEFNKPFPFSDFCLGCEINQRSHKGYNKEYCGSCDQFKPKIKRPPQSWCYVEELR